MNKPELRILHTLSRSGGTLVSRCLGCMKNIVILSEIHPHGMQWNNPLSQANEWFQLFSENDIRHFSDSPLPFIEAIQLIHQRCTESGKTLIIRSWDHLDYFGKPFLPAANFQPTLTNQLSGHFQIIQNTLVRHPVDQWISLNNLKIMRNQLTIDEFLLGYLRFSQLAVKTGFAKFEEFTQTPDQELSALCFWLKLNFDETYSGRWHKFTKISGDMNQVVESKNFIAPLKRFGNPDEVLTLFRKHDAYYQALETLGYPDA